MSAKIRLARGGTKKRPFYRVVVADVRAARDGKFIEKLGTFNPLLPKDSKERLVIDIERAKEWLAKGAQTTDRMEKILVAEGLMEAKTDFASKVKKAVKNPGKQNRAEDRAKAAEEAKAAAEAPAVEEAAPAAEEAPAAEAPAEETPAAE